MASDDSSGARPAAPIVLRIKLRYDDVEAMVQRFAANVGKSGLFLPTRSLQPIGAEIKFELRLADDTPALVGLGRVRTARPPDPHNPRAAFGMTVELMRVTPQSRALILRMLERRRELGLPEIGLPTASDIDAARRAEAVEAAGRDPASGPVPAGVAAPAAAGPGAPAAVAPVAPVERPVGEALLTAPRRTTGPLAVAKVAAIAPLAPEPPRRRRVALSELIERASGPVAGVSPVPGLDDSVDVAATIARARALAGGSPDAELDALCEAAAVPLEISIEAASAELARQLGGSAVRRDRSAGWAPPPATAAAVPAATPDGDGMPDGPAPAEEAPPGDEPPVAAGEAMAGEAMAGEAMAGDAAGEAMAGEAMAGEAMAGEAAAEAPAAPAPADSEPTPLPAPPMADLAAAAVALAADDGAAGALAELDSDERTETGDMPGARGGFELPAQLDQPGAAEPPLELGVDEFDDFEILAEADADDEDLLASHGEHDASSRREVHARPRTGERRPSELDFASRLDLGEDSDPYVRSPSDELSARHVIDMLQDELTGQHTGGPRGARFADPVAADPHAISAGAALAALEDDDSLGDDAGGGDDPDLDDSDASVRPIFDPDSSSSFTIAGIPSDAIDLDALPPRRAAPVEPPRPVHRQPAAPRVEPAMLRHAPRSLHDGPVDDDELEHALEALDVDLDDLSIPHAATELQRDVPRAPAALRSPAEPRIPASQTRAPALQARTKLPTPAPQARATLPSSAPQPRATRSTPAPQPRSGAASPAGGARALAPTAAPPPRAPAATPSRAFRRTGPGAPASGRIALPRAPSDEGVDVDLDDDD